jgi:hypothetical protein
MGPLQFDGIGPFLRESAALAAQSPHGYFFSLEAR